MYQKSGKITASISDSNGLKAYAVTQSSTTPAADSSEWIVLDNSSALSDTIKKMATAPTSKTIEYSANEVGTYYIHVKNSLDMVSKKTVTIESIEKVTVVDYIKELAATNTNELRIDKHAATGNQKFASTDYRYYGATPNNYVTFNNELWRIIGVMTVENETGTPEERVKIIRDASLGNYSWDSSASTVNGGGGVNEWSQADVKTLLNDTYYNAKSGTCYAGSKNATISCDFTSTGLTLDAKSMISSVKWYTGASNNSSPTSSQFYEAERGTTTGKICSSGTMCNDTVTRTTTWVGKIGLMYPSDYGYAADMATCSTIALYSYSSSCKSSDWLLSSTSQWTMSTVAYSSRASGSFSVYSSGIVSGSYSDDTIGVRPVTYLTSDIAIANGTGTSSDPFILTK